MAEILSAPNPVLSKKAEEITKFDKSLESLIKKMVKALESASDPIGVGLAGPQIGESKQIFITKPNSKAKISVFINPKIVSFEKPKKTKKKRVSKLEGCLSLPSIWGEVERYPQIILNYLDEKGKNYTKEFIGFMAIIAQHEIDHLNGVLFTKRVLEQKGRLYESKKDAKGQDYFEEIQI
jgi:peptide deformylase